MFTDGAPPALFVAGIRGLRRLRELPCPVKYSFTAARSPTPVGPLVKIVEFFWNENDPFALSLVLDSE
jgi:hypothetical protein